MPTLAAHLRPGTEMARYPGVMETTTALGDACVVDRAELRPERPGFPVATATPRCPRYGTWPGRASSSGRSAPPTMPTLTATVLVSGWTSDPTVSARSKRWLLTHRQR
jgi:hypothetical protein